MLISLTGALVQDLICPIPPETGNGPESPTYKEIIKRRRGRLQPTIIEDDEYFWQCYPFIRYVRTESNTVTPGWKRYVGYVHRLMYGSAFVLASNTRGTHLLDPCDPRLFSYRFGYERTAVRVTALCLVQYRVVVSRSLFPARGSVYGPEPRGALLSG